MLSSSISLGDLNLSNIITPITSPSRDNSCPHRIYKTDSPVSSQPQTPTRSRVERHVSWKGDKSIRTPTPDRKVNFTDSTIQEKHHYVYKEKEIERSNSTLRSNSRGSIPTSAIVDGKDCIMKANSKGTLSPSVSSDTILIENVRIVEKHRKKKNLLGFKREKASSQSTRDSKSPSNSQESLLNSLDLSTKIQKFEVFLEEEQQHTFAFNSEQILSEVLEKLSTRGFTLDLYEPRDGRGNTLDVNLKLGELPSRQIFFLSKDSIDLPTHTIITIDDRIFSRSKIFKERSIAEYQKILENEKYEEKVINFSIRSPLAKRERRQQKTTSTVLYSHMHTYSPDLLQVKVDQNGNVAVMAGNLDTLIEILTHPLGRDLDFELTFIMSSDGFIKPKELFSKIIERWNIDNIAIKENIIDLFKVWINLRIDILEDDEELKEGFVSWVENADFTQVDEMKAKGFQLFVTSQLEGKRSEYKRDIERMLQEEFLEDAPESIPILNLIHALDPDFFCFDPTELARQLTLLDAQLLRKIKPHEWLHQGWMKGKSTNIINFINRFNQMSGWFSTLIVLGESKELRAALITRLINIALVCQDLNNYNCILQIVTALSSTSCSRLLQTWQLIDPATLKQFEKLQELVTVRNKFKTLRDAQENTEGPVVPYLGIYLGDITFIEDGNPDYTADSLINFDKYRMVSQLVLRFEEFKHRGHYKLYPLKSLQNWLENPMILSEDDIFQESLARESKEENSQLKLKLGKK